jgi:hypothetical protein
LPAIDAAAMASLLRWLMAAIVVAVLVWFADRWLRRWVGQGESQAPRKG